jgi:signal transduction histidine kinase
VSDVHFLRQAIDQLASQVEHAHLLQKIAAAAAGEERRRISLDLHDSTIQPYLGLKLGLEALRHKVGEDHPLARDLDELCQMTTESIVDLRSYVYGLKGFPSNPSLSLLDAVRQQADKFMRLYDIRVDINAELNTEIQGQLAAEVVQMISESLSNVGRHTTSTHVTINLLQQGSHFVAQTINHNPLSHAVWKPFTPRSIVERAGNLGGWVDVAQREDGNTAVTVHIPYVQAQAAA